jgi:UDP-N-acetylmuramoylalanine--D-glutamate ligase
VLNADNARTEAAAVHSQSEVYWFSIAHPVSQGAGVDDGWVVYRAKHQGEGERIIPVSKIPLKGGHNVENVLAAVCAARLAGVPVEVIGRAVEKFHAVEHRLEFVETINGVEFYNDSKATNVDATAKAVAAFAGGIHLILGGKDKGSDYTTLSQLLRERVRAVYTIGAAAAKIETQLHGVIPIDHCETLAKAVDAASCAARPGDVVLLAPACSSFDQFENYEERGRLFKKLVCERREWKVRQDA